MIYFDFFKFFIRFYFIFCGGTYDSVLVGPRLQGSPRSKAWLLGELGIICSAPQDFLVLGVFCARLAIDRWEEGGLSWLFQVPRYGLGFFSLPHRQREGKGSGPRVGSADKSSHPPSSSSSDDDEDSSR